jgi:signal transduction histidine kinase
MQVYEQAIFISYAWGGESEEIVNQIDTTLQHHGFRIIRDKRDLGYKGSISVFMERIGQGNCIIIVISDKYLRSPNCMFELVEISDGKQFHDRVFPIILPDTNIYDPIKRLEYVKYWEIKRAELAQAMMGVDPANLQGVREEMDLYDHIRNKISGLTSILKDMNTLTPDIHRNLNFKEIYTGIERRIAETSNLPKPETDESPYLGLRFFDIKHAPLFYGRESLTIELLTRIRKESFLVVVGASGSGKSSLVRAGLIPVWKRENADLNIVHVITPTALPLESIATTLTPKSESVTTISSLMDDMMKDHRSLRLFVRRLMADSAKQKALIVIDQFEETFSLCKDSEERKAFIENLLSLPDEENSAVHVVLALRADFYHHCAEYEGLRVMLQKHQAYIGAMTQDELRKAISLPAEKNGLDFQPRLVDLILQDVGTEPGALPLLSHALLETWRRREGRTLTLHGYTNAGGVKKAIAQTAESVYNSLPPSDQEIARNIFLRLTELSEGMQDTRRRVKLDELSQLNDSDAVAKVLKTLTDARLITTEQETAEVAHEALIREWNMLRKWLDEDRDRLRMHHHLAQSAQEWEYSHRDEQFLVHRGGRLDDVLLLKEISGYRLTLVEQLYLDACLLLRKNEQIEREQQLNERRNSIQMKTALEISEMVGTQLNIEEIIVKVLEKLKSLFQGTALCVLLYDEDKQLLEFTPRTLLYYEIVNPEYKNLRSFPVHGTGSRSIACKVARAALTSRKQEHHQAENVRDDPDYLPLNPRTVSELCVSLMDGTGNLLGVLALEREQAAFEENDVPLVEVVARQLAQAIERSRIIERLTFKEDVATMTAWASDIAHDINSEVGQIRGNAYLIKLIGQDADIVQFADEIDKSARKLTSVGPWSTQAKKEIPLDDSLRGFLEPLVSQRNVKLELDLCTPDIYIKANPTEFQHVLRHLVRNSVRAMEKNSDIKEKKISVLTRSITDGRVEILFCDNGPGVDEDVRAAIFQRKVPFKPASGGYGLLISRQLIDDMGGKITLLPTEPDQGATFSIKLPVVSTLYDVE